MVERGCADTKTSGELGKRRRQFPGPIYSDTWMKFISEDILDYLITQMSDKSKGFYVSEDADSEGEEGKYYVWEYDELRKIFNDTEFQIANNLFDNLC